jgi:hypothetical protein
VSVVGYDAKSGFSYRNGNVMYEVGLALACRQSAEVLLLRDDRAPFLFDVSTVPHMHVDFSDAEAARTAVAQEIVMRLKEVDRVRDARVSLAVASLTAGERIVLAAFSKNQMGETFWLRKETLKAVAALERLLDKQLIRTRGATSEGSAMVSWTELGRVVADNLEQLAPMLELPTIEIESKGATAEDNPSEPEDGTI